MQAHGTDHDAHAAPAHGAGSAAAAADPDWNFWLGGMLLFCGALTLVFVYAAKHGAGENKAPVATAHAGAAGHGADGHAASGKQPVRPTDEQRTAEVLSALTGHAMVDDSVPPEATADIKFIIQAVAESGLSFKLKSEPKSAADVAEWLMKRWQNAEDPIYSAESLMARTTGFSLVDQLTNRVVFKDGTEMALSTWLQVKLAERRGEPPPVIPTKPVHPPPRANKKKKAEQAEPKAGETPAPTPGGAPK
jgi:hypothetical protein